LDKPTIKGRVTQMNKTYVIITAVVAIALIASAAFIYVHYQGQTPDEENVALQNLVDDHGDMTSLTAYPESIVSLAPSATEIVFAVGAGDNVVGVTNYCDYPYNFSAWIEAGNMTSVGGFQDINVEVVASLNPDLILATGGIQQETVGSLRDLGYNVIVLDPTNIDGVFQDIELVGNATGKRDMAMELVNNMASRIDTVANKVADAASKPKVYYEVWWTEQSIWSVGAKGFENELIAKAGGINIFENDSLEHFQTDSEVIISKNPDIILLPVGMETIGSDLPFWKSFDAVKARPAWDSINAVQNDALYQIDGNAIERAGPRIADMIETLAAIFHPELF
jgi:iron complex transport system substrate-binding protein